MRKTVLLIIMIMIQHQLQSQDIIKISADLEMIRISNNAFIHVSWTELPGYGRVAANGLIFISGHKAFLFDSPWNDTQTEILVTYLEEEMGLKIKGFVPNHWHEDCMGGLGYLKSRKIISYAGSLTQQITRDKGLPVPDHGFIDSLILRLGRKEICCYFPGAAHTTDNIVIWIPSERILFPGCICKSADAGNLGNTADGDLAAYPETVDWIIRKFPGAKTVIPGHGSYGGPELLTHTLSLAANK
jgi:metallo-beta-lactamase class B